MKFEVKFKISGSEEDILVNILIKRERKGKYILQHNAFAKL